MSTVTIKQECGCFKRSDMQNNKSFESKDDALIEATNMVAHMNEKFCGKHNFEALEQDGNMIIAMQVPKEQSSACCGGGHCS